MAKLTTFTDDKFGIQDSEVKYELVDGKLTK